MVGKRISTVGAQIPRLEDPHVWVTRRQGNKTGFLDCFAHGPGYDVTRSSTEGRGKQCVEEKAALFLLTHSPGTRPQRIRGRKEVVVFRSLGCKEARLTRRDRLPLVPITSFNKGDRGDDSLFIFSDIGVYVLFEKKRKKKTVLAFEKESGFGKFAGAWVGNNPFRFVPRRAVPVLRSGGETQGGGGLGGPRRGAEEKTRGRGTYCLVGAPMRSLAVQEKNQPGLGD